MPNVETFLGDDALDQVRGAWEGLLARHPEPGPHLTFDFVSACWKRQRGYRGGQLLVVVVSDEAGPVLIAPFVRRRELGLFFNLTLLNSSTPFYSDVLADPARLDEAAWEAFWRVLDGMARTRRLRADWVADDAMLIKGLGHRPHQWGGKARRFGYRHDAAQGGDYLRHLSPRHRAAFRRMNRRMGEQGELRFVRIDEETLAPALDRLFAEKSRWLRRRGIAKSWLKAPDTRSLFEQVSRRFAQTGRLWFEELQIDGAMVASVLAFRIDDRLFISKSAYDPTWRLRSPGDVLHIHVCRQAIADGVRRIDFMIGDFEWKHRLGNEAGSVRFLRAPLGRAVQRATQ